MFGLSFHVCRFGRAPRPGAVSIGPRNSHYVCFAYTCLVFSRFRSSCFIASQQHHIAAALHAPPHTTPSIRACLKLTPPPGSVRKSISLSLSLSLPHRTRAWRPHLAIQITHQPSGPLRSAITKCMQMACTHDPSATRRPPLALVANVLAAHVCSSRRLCAH